MTDEQMFQVAKDQCSIIQQKSEILWALSEARKHLGKAEIIVELGCAGGGSLCMWSQILRYTGLLIGISPNDNWQEQQTKVRQITDKRAFLIDGLSEDHDTMDRLKGLLDGRKIDFLFIDTTHTYRQSEREFNLYESLVSPSGIIGFHDIAQFGLAEQLGECCTGDYWNHLKYGYDYVEKHDKVGGINFGIGLLLMT